MEFWIFFFEKKKNNNLNYLPAPLSLAKTCSVMVIFEEFEAERNEEYMTQRSQITKPMILSKSKPICGFLSSTPTMPKSPGLQFLSF